MLEEKAQQYMVKISSVESLHAVVTCLTDCVIQIISVVQGENLLFGVMACCGYLLTDSAIQISSVLQGENLLCVVIACSSDMPTNSSTEVSEGKPECYKARQF